MPTPPSSGDGARIYAHQDDTEAVIYGAFFAASDNPFGVDAFIAQFDACHFSCSPGTDITIQYNVALLTDGTVIIAHNLAGPEEGSSATVGIQNETFDDGVAYLADEAGGIIDGQTIIIIPPESGLSADIRNVATEAGLTEAAALAANVAGQLATGGTSDLAAQSIANPVQRDMSDTLARFKPWVTAGGLYSETGDTSPIETISLYVQGGVDLYRTDRFVAGVGLAFTKGDATLGAATVDTGSEAIFFYGGATLAGWDFGGTLSYGATHYENLETAFLGDINADGERATLSLSATKDFDIGNDLTVAPRLLFLAGHEEIEDWATGEDLSRSVEASTFYKAELTGKIARQFDNLGGGTGYFLAGADYLSVEGDSDTALLTAGYEHERVGGVAGLGVEGLMIGDMVLSVDLTASGITDNSYTINGGFTLQF